MFYFKCLRYEYVKHAPHKCRMIKKKEEIINFKKGHFAQKSPNENNAHFTYLSFFGSDLDFLHRYVHISLRSTKLFFRRTLLLLWLVVDIFEVSKLVYVLFRVFFIPHLDMIYTLFRLAFKSNFSFLLLGIRTFF